MKQVIIEIRDGEEKLIAKRGYDSKEAFNDNATNFIFSHLYYDYKVEIIFGELYKKSMTYIELLDLQEAFEIVNSSYISEYEVIDSYVTNDYDTQYYLKEYLK